MNYKKVINVQWGYKIIHISILCYDHNVWVLILTVLKRSKWPQQLIDLCNNNAETDLGLKQVSYC